MASLYFRYGTMKASKTTNALMLRFNYMERGKDVILLKAQPHMGDIDEEKIIKSRIGLSAKCMFVDDFICHAKQAWLSNNYLIRGIRYPSPKAYSAIIIDEAQFLTAEQVDVFAGIVDMFDLPVLCYGLRTDFQGHLFEGSKRLMEVSDVIEEIPSICWCGKRAQFTARIRDERIIRHGKQIMIDGNEEYVPLCRKHYVQGMLSQND